MHKFKFLKFWIIIMVIGIFIIGCSTHPKITAEKIGKDMKGKTMGEGLFALIFSEVPPETITILETEYKGEHATIVINLVLTYQSGKIRLHYEWIANEWTLMKMENLTFK